MALGGYHGGFGGGNLWDERPTYVKKPPKRKPVPKKPDRALTNTAKKWVTENVESILTEPELKKPTRTITPPKGSPYRPGAYVPKGPRVRQPTVDERFTMATAATFSPQARQDLADTVSPARRRELLRQANQRRRAIRDEIGGGDFPAPRAWWEKGLDIGLDVAESVLPFPVPLAGRAAVEVGKDPLRYGRTARDIGRGTLETGEVLGGMAGRLAARGVASGASALMQLRDFGGNLEEGGSPLRISGATETAKAAAFPVPTGQQLVDVGLGVGKVAVGAPAAVAGLVANPIRGARQFIDMARGSGAAAVALIPALVSSQVSKSKKEQLLNEVARSFWDDLVKRYGPDVTWKQAAIDNPYNEPVLHLMDALAIAVPTARGAGLYRYIKAGATVGEARKLLRDPTRLSEFPHVAAKPHQPRAVTVRDPYAAPRQVELPESRDPLMRGVQRGYDVATRGLERAVGDKYAARTLTTPTRRGLRQERTILKRNLRRLEADGQILWRDVARYVGNDTARGARLFHTMEKPADVPEEAWLRGLLEDTQAMLAGRAVITGGRASATEAKLVKRMERFRAEVEKAGRDRWLTRVANVHHEQQRLAHSLLATEDNLRQARAHLRDVKALEIDEYSKGRRVRAAEDDVRDLERERKALRDQLGDLHIEQAPVASEMRTRIQETYAAHPNITEEQAETLMVLHDANAREWARLHPGRDPGEYYTAEDGFNLADIRMFQHHTDLPEGALAQIRFNLERGPARPVSSYPNLAPGPETAAHNLRYVEGGDLYKPHLGNAENKKIFRTLKTGERVQVVGPITPKEWIKRVVAVVRDPAERDKLARWYETAAPTIERFFGDTPEAEAILRGFAVSQANDSPTGGLQSTLRVYDKIRAREPVSPDEISTVVKQIEQAVQGQHVSRGLAAKLHDFADSLQGKQTRTWMGDDPRGGKPTANDVHAIRDLGRVDKKIVERLRNPLPTALYRKGLKEDEFRVDSGGSPGDHQYERMREEYTEIADELNRIGFDGRSDWEPYQAQALGWSAIQRLHGVVPEDLEYAVKQNARRINLEVTRGVNEIGNDLTPAQAQMVIKEVAPAIRDIIEEMDGLWLDGGFDVAISAYEGTPNASVHFDVIGSPERTHDLVLALVDAFDQYDVWATRTSTSGGAKPTLVVWHPELDDPTKALALYRELYAADPKRFAGFAMGEEDGVPSIRLVMPGKTVFSTEHDSRLDALMPMINSAVESALPGYDVEARLTNTQVISKEWKGARKKRRVEGAGSEGALRDPHLAEARERLTEAVERARGQQAEPARVTRLNQTRRNDLLGAVQFLDTPEGGRILYLSEQADVSTLLHELYGHGVREIAQAYPERWARVEQFFGAPLAEWSVEDHERFARMAERWFSEGRAPSPELVPVFANLKAWMRAIYGAESRILGERMPEIVRDLFDEMFGAYNDDNVYRVAQMVARDPQEMNATRAHALWEFSSEELAALRRRNDTRAFNRTREGLEKKLDEQITSMEKKHGDWESAPLRVQEQIQATYAQLLDVVSAEEMAKVDRETGLRQRVELLERALKDAQQDDPEFNAALGSLQALQDNREQMLREIFGDRYDEVFANRADLMADFLAERGLIPSDFARGTARYVRHGAVGESRVRQVERPAAALTGQTIGQVDKAMLNLHNRNNLMRWQNGDLNADPRVVLEAWLNATMFDYVKGLKDHLRDAGRQLGRHEAIPDDAYVILDGTPLPWLQRASMKPGSAADAQRIANALEGRDPAAMEASVAEYFDNVFKDGKELKEILAAQADPIAARGQLNAWVISKGQVDQLFRPLRGSRGGVPGTVWDIANTVARWSMIYTNPAYVPINFIGNNFFLLAQQGPGAVKRLVQAARIMHSDKELATMILAEVGQLPALAAVARGRAGTRGQRLRQREERALRGYASLPDKWPRTAAWIYEAQRRGYQTPEDMKRLLRSKTEKSSKDREVVADRSTEIMVNFDRMGDRERQIVTRILFVWPWIRGATAWPFYYAREFPMRTAVAAHVGNEVEKRRKAMMGNVSPAYRDLFPVSFNEDGSVAKVVNIGPISPTSTAVQSFEGIVGNIESLFSNQKLDPGTRLSDYLQPLLAMAQQGISGHDDFGRQVGLRDALLDNVLNFVPFGQLGRQLVDPTKASKTYTRRGAKDLLERKFLRLTPQEVSLHRLHAFQQQAGEKKTTADKVNDTVADLRKRVQTDLGIKNPDPLPTTVQRAIEIQHAYWDKRDQLKKEIKDGGHWYPKKPNQTEPTLTARQEAGIVYALYQLHAPEVAAGLLAPDDVEPGGHDRYVQILLHGDKDYGFHGLLSPLDDYRRTISKYKREREEVTGG